MIELLQTLLTSLISFGTIYYNYDVNDKILRTLPPKWRAQDTSLSASKGLEKMSLKELVGILIFHKYILQGGEKKSKV